jgi:hypothetical protein
MRITTVIFSLSVLLLCFAYGAQASAEPLLPCVKAVSSSKGNFFVLTELQLQPLTQNSSRVQRVFLEVFPKETFDNEKFTAPATYWTDWLRWSVVLDGDRLQDDPGCPLPLISDDGEFLVLLHMGATLDDTPVLQIYRRRDHLGDPVRKGPDHGIFIKAIALKQIWPQSKLGATALTDGTPEWFAGGTFDFSSDYRTLIHKTRWGNTVTINLEDGSVSMVEAEKPSDASRAESHRAMTPTPSSM